MHLTLSTVLVYTNDDYSPLFVQFAIHDYSLFAICDYSLFAIRDYSLFAIRVFQTPLSADADGSNKLEELYFSDILFPRPEII